MLAECKASKADLSSCKARQALKSDLSDAQPENERSEKTVDCFVIDAHSSGALAAHLGDRGYNRNRRRRERFTKRKVVSTEEKGKGKNSVDEKPAPPLPRRVARKVVQFAELPSITEDGVTIYSARKVRQLPDGLGSVGSRALHVKLRVGSLAQAVLTGRLDSGADITLMHLIRWVFRKTHGLLPGEEMRSARANHI